MHCVFFTNGECHFGDKCHNAHDDKTLEKLPICRFEAEAVGGCKFGVKCRNVHGVACPSCHRSVLHPWNDAMNREHQKACMPADSIRAVPEASNSRPNAIGALRAKPKMECGICLEEFEISISSRVAVLEHCQHLFCLQCIHRWRRTDSDTAKQCPQCRKPSRFVLASSRKPVDADDHRRLVDAFVVRCSRISCKYFEKSRGKFCPHVNDCVYAHNDARGRRVILRPRRSRAQPTIGDLERMLAILYRDVYGHDADSLGEITDYDDFSDYSDQDNGDFWGGFHMPRDDGSEFDEANYSDYYGSDDDEEHTTSEGEESIPEDLVSVYSDYS